MREGRWKNGEDGRGKGEGGMRKGEGGRWMGWNCCVEKQSILCRSLGDMFKGFKG